MNRRNFLIWGSTALAGGSVGLSLLSGCAGKNSKDAIPLLTILPTSTIRAIGAAYIKQYPKFSPIPIEQNNTAALSRQITEEYAAEQIAVYDGWIIADTEAKYCAIFLLQ